MNKMRADEIQELHLALDKLKKEMHDELIAANNAVNQEIITH